MHRRIQRLFLSVLLLTCFGVDGAELADRLESMLAGKRFEQAQIGIKVVSLADGESVFERNAAQLFHPASNAKLFTAALVLDRLDPERRIQTSAYGTVAPDGAGRVDGDLVVYGRGDPSLAPRYHRGDARAPFREFATAIHRAGLRQVAGDLIADESYFNAPPFGTGWTWDELEIGRAHV